MPADSPWLVERVTAEQTRPLRQHVLRPHQRLDEVVFAGEDAPGTAFWAAFGPGRDIVGVVTVMRQCPASTTATDPNRWWRLRGMATADDYRNRGVGSALVAAVVAYVAAQEGTVLWCHARMTAVPFYRKLGFVTMGDPWDEPPLGPHVAMWRAVPRPS